MRPLFGRQEKMKEGSPGVVPSIVKSSTSKKVSSPNKEIQKTNLSNSLREGYAKL